MEHNPTERYSRQILLPEVGIEGQKKIMKARVLVIGAGGLGSPVIEYLSGAGVGTIGIVDGDTVDISNLHRQPIHNIETISRLKEISAGERAQKINPFSKIVFPVTGRFTIENAAELVSQFDIIVDAVDNFSIKYLINDACIFHNKSYVHAGIVKWAGQVFTHIPGSPCLRCLMPQIPSADVVPSCSRAGILGPVAGIIGCIQATEVLKLLIESDKCLVGKFAKFDAKLMTLKTSRFNMNATCQICGINPTITFLKEEEQLLCDLQGK